jgi:hypothetical protein
MSETPERDLVELSNALKAQNHPPSSMEEAVLIHATLLSQAINRFRQAMVFDVNALSPPTDERKALRQRLVQRLNSLHCLFKDLNMQGLSSDFDELQSALEDVNYGVRHPMFGLSSPKKTESSRVWRARANLVLAIEARRRLAASFAETTLQFLNSKNLDLACRLARKKTIHYSVAEEKEDLKKTIVTWRKNLSSRPANKEAGELYRVTKHLIQSYKGNESMLRRIEARCLKVALRNIAIKDGSASDNYNDAFLVRADRAREFAVFTGKLTQETVAIARRVATVWSDLANAMEERLGIEAADGSAVRK